MTKSDTQVTQWDLVIAALTEAGCNCDPVLIDQYADNIVMQVRFYRDVNLVMKVSTYSKLEKALRRTASVLNELKRTNPEALRYLNVGSEGFHDIVERLRKRVLLSKPDIDSGAATGRKENLLEAVLANEAIEAFEGITGVKAPYPNWSGLQTGNEGSFEPLHTLAKKLFKAFNSKSPPIKYLRAVLDERLNPQEAVAETA